MPDWQGRAGDFNEKYQADSGGHVANLRAAVALMCGDGTEWAECQGTPTKPNYSDGWGWNIVPKTA